MQELEGQGTGCKAGRPVCTSKPSTPCSEEKLKRVGNDNFTKGLTGVLNMAPALRGQHFITTPSHYLEGWWQTCVLYGFSRSKGLFLVPPLTPPENLIKSHSQLLSNTSNTHTHIHTNQRQLRHTSAKFCFWWRSKMIPVKN